MQSLALHTIPFYSFSSCYHQQQQQQPYPSFQEPPEMSPASSSSIAGDHIGLESCLDMVKTAPDAAAAEETGASVGYCYFSERVQQRREQRKEMRRKEYPPPIPLLARTENLPSHMPWVLRRYYTGDGRLILREEKVRHHEYLRAHREDGRLTLHLVPMDDNVMNPRPDSPIDDEEECFDLVDGDGEVGHGHGHETEQETEQTEEVAGGGSCCYDNDDDEEINNGCGEDTHKHECGVVNVVVGGGGCGGGGGGGGKCLGYANTRASGVGSACIFGVPISPIRPVHS